MVLSFKTYNYKIIKLFLIKVLWPLVAYLNIYCKEPVNLPLKKIRFTVNRSYHVTSKSKEHYEIKTYNVLLDLPLVLNSIQNLKKFKIYLTSNLKTGLSLKIFKKF